MRNAVLTWTIAAASAAVLVGNALVPDRVTLNAQPNSLRSGQQATLFGAISSGRANEEVTIQAKDCGQRAFTGVSVPPFGVVQTGAGGTFTTQLSRFINTTVRAVWNGEASPPVEIRQQPRVVLSQPSAGRFEAAVASRWTFWRKKLQVQRRVGSRWTTVRTVTLTDTVAHLGGSSWTEVEFRMRMPRGTLLRASLKADQAKPCYLAATSDPIRA